MFEFLISVVITEFFPILFTLEVIYCHSRTGVFVPFVAFLSKELK